MDSDLVLDVPNDVHAIGKVVDRVLARCETCPADTRRMRLNLRVGLTEALSNAILYGNGADPSKRVRLEVSLEARAVVVRVTDEGNGFDPRHVPDPTTPDNLLRAGGRGIFLMRELLDEVRFNERGNSVTLVLRHSSGGTARGGHSA